MLEIIVIGEASQKLIAKFCLKEIPQMSLMDYLRSQEIPIASSCLGKGICKKCVFNKDNLSCQTWLNELKQSPFYVNISYL